MRRGVNMHIHVCPLARGHTAASVHPFHIISVLACLACLPRVGGGVQLLQPRLLLHKDGGGGGIYMVVVWLGEGKDRRAGKQAGRMGGSTVCACICCNHTTLGKTDKTNLVLLNLAAIWSHAPFLPP